MQPYKNTYLVDMATVLKNPSKYTLSDNISLPIIKRNGQDTKDFISGCSYPCVTQMLKKYRRLSEIIGATEAGTLIEYLDTNGKPLLILYPTNETDLHNPSWSLFSLDAQKDMRDIQSKREEQIANFKKQTTQLAH